MARCNHRSYNDYVFYDGYETLLWVTLFSLVLYLSYNQCESVVVLRFSELFCSASCSGSWTILATISAYVCHSEPGVLPWPFLLLTGILL